MTPVELHAFKNKPLKGIFYYKGLLFIAQGNDGFRIERIKSRDTVPELHKEYTKEVIQKIMTAD